MNISDTFYVALCMTVLILGVVYWFWTQNQYIQRKLNLLENIVYEMKTSLNAIPAKEGPTYPLAPVPMDEEDELHEELQEMNITAKEEMKIDEHAPTLMPLDTIPETFPISEFPDVGDSDLQPGGVGSSLPEASAPEPDSSSSVLDNMTLKELRRLAEQRKISGASSMRKQALIDALRSGTVVSKLSPFETSDGVEGNTLDLS